MRNRTPLSWRAATACTALAAAALMLTATAAAAQKVSTSPTGASVVEGATRTYELRLSQPIIFPGGVPPEQQSVTLALTADLPDRVTASPASVSWGASEWSQTRTVDIAATANAVTGDSAPVVLSGTVVSGAPYYANYHVQFTVQVVDASPVATTTSGPAATTTTSTTAPAPTTTIATSAAAATSAAGVVGAVEATTSEEPVLDDRPPASARTDRAAAERTSDPDDAPPSAAATVQGVAPIVVVATPTDERAGEGDVAPERPEATAVRAERRVGRDTRADGPSTLLSLLLGTVAGVTVPSIVLATMQRPRRRTISRRGRAG